MASPQSDGCGRLRVQAGGEERHFRRIAEARKRQLLDRLLLDASDPPPVADDRPLPTDGPL